MGFYFGFQKFFIVERLAIDFFFISAVTLFQLMLDFSNNVLS